MMFMEFLEKYIRGKNGNQKYNFVKDFLEIANEARDTTFKLNVKEVGREYIKNKITKYYEVRDLSNPIV
jgi:hypothetical protein